MTEGRTAGAVILCVHGTFAALAGDAGTAWWQTGSPFQTALAARLPGCAIAPVFHWSGANDQRDRERAALELLETRLLPLEQAGTPYHIVAHSHGGSVVWKALQFAHAAGQRLEGLRSWTTVGTPFARPAFAYSLAEGLTYMLHFGLLMWSVLYLVPLALNKLVLLPLAGLVSGDASFWLGALQRANAAWVTSPKRWVAISGIFGLFYAPWVKHREWLHSRSLEEDAFTRFGARWLGLYSAHDEVLASLAGVVTLDGPLVARRRTFEQRLADELALEPDTARTGPLHRLHRTLVRSGLMLSFSDRLRRHTSAVAWLNPFRWLDIALNELFNRVVAPHADRAIWTVLARSAHGLADPFQTAAPAVPGPLPAPGAYVPLPDALDRAIVEAADRHAAVLVPRLRRVLAQGALGAPAAVVGTDALSALTWGELVHTGYFEQPELLALVVAHIENDGVTPHHAWVRATKTRVAEQVLAPLAKRSS